MDQLHRNLLDSSKHDPHVRPVRNVSDTVKVILRINLYQILDVDERVQQVMLYVWTTQYWYDEVLVWNPNDYDNIDWITLPWNRVWVPDTVLYNSVVMLPGASERYISVKLHQNASASKHSLAVFQYPAIYRFTCKMNIFDFPFDTQNCTLIFSSWVYDSSGIDFYPHGDHVTFESYVESGEWTIISFGLNRQLMKFNCCDVPWSVLYANLVIKRKPLYYMANLVAPIGIITLIAMVGFFTPSTTTGERMQKVDLGITTLFTMSILLLMVSDKMPTTSNFLPLMGWYFLTVIGLISLATVLTSCIIVVEKRQRFDRPLPACVRFLLYRILSPVLFISPPVELHAHVTREKAKQTWRKSFVVTDLSYDEPPTPRPTISGQPRGLLYELQHPQTTQDDHKSNSELISALQDVKRSMQRLTDVFTDNDEKPKMVEMEFVYLTTVLDRFFLVMFFVLIFIVNGIMVYLSFR